MLRFAADEETIEERGYLTCPSSCRLSLKVESSMSGSDLVALSIAPGLLPGAAAWSQPKAGAVPALSGGPPAAGAGGAEGASGLRG